MQQKLFSKFIFSVLIFSIIIFSFASIKQARAEGPVQVTDVLPSALSQLASVLADKPTATKNWEEVFKKNIEDLKKEVLRKIGNSMRMMVMKMIQKMLSQINNDIFKKAASMLIKNFYENFEDEMAKSREYVEDQIAESGIEDEIVSDAHPDRQAPLREIIKTAKEFEENPTLALKERLACPQEAQDMKEIKSWEQLRTYSQYPGCHPAGGIVMARAAGKGIAQMASEQARALTEDKRIKEQNPYRTDVDRTGAVRADSQNGAQYGSDVQDSVRAARSAEMDRPGRVAAAISANTGELDISSAITDILNSFLGQLIDKGLGSIDQILAQWDGPTKENPNAPISPTSSISINEENYEQWSADELPAGRELLQNQKLYTESLTANLLTEEQNNLNVLQQISNLYKNVLETLAFKIYPKYPKCSLPTWAKATEIPVRQISAKSIAPISSSASSNLVEIKTDYYGTIVFNKQTNIATNLNLSPIQIRIDSEQRAIDDIQASITNANLGATATEQFINNAEKFWKGEIDKQTTIDSRNLAIRLTQQITNSQSTNFLQLAGETELLNMNLVLRINGIRERRGDATANTGLYGEINNTNNEITALEQGLTICSNFGGGKPF